MGNLESELLGDIFARLEEIIGEKAVKLLKNRIGESTNDVPKAVFEIATYMGETFGQRGANSVLRELGRAVAKDLMNAHSQSEWERIFKEGLKLLGFAEGVKRKGRRACICSCVFYPRFLSNIGLEAMQHPVCWIGLGFVEGFMRAFTGAKGVKFSERNLKENACWFEIL
jgi:predicted hydrocarbon binding protein